MTAYHAVLQRLIEYFNWLDGVPSAAPKGWPSRAGCQRVKGGWRSSPVEAPPNLLRLQAALRRLPRMNQLAVRCRFLPEGFLAFKERYPGATLSEYNNLLEQSYASLTSESRQNQL